MDTVIKKWLIRIIILLLLLLCGWILNLLWPVLQPIVSGVWLAAVPLLVSILLAYLLVPFVHFLIKGKCSNRLAVWIVFITLAGLIGTLFQWGVPALLKEWKHFLEHLPSLVQQFSNWNLKLDGFLSGMPKPLHSMIDEAIERFGQRIEMRAEEILGGIDHSFKWIIALTLVPFMTFYLLKDRITIGEWLFKFVSDKRKEKVLSVVKDIDKRLGGYVRGQLWLCLAVGAVSTVALFLIDVPYAIPLGAIMGLFNVIPYVGPVIGALPAVLVASTVSGSLLVWVIAITFVIQMLESHLLAPWIMGRNVHIHPVVIMLLLLLGGELAGVLGLIIAVPLYMMALIVVKAFILPQSDRIIDK